jgi:hypothetical protein
VDAKSRKALIDSLVVAKRFDDVLTADNQRWFVRKLIDVYQARGESDANIKSKTSADVTRAKTAATKHRDFKISIKTNTNDKATLRILRRRRVEILYGLMAFDPELADPANAKQLLFVARRRYRAVERFQFYVNPNGRGYVRYDDTCPSNRRWRVNADANALWIHTSTGYYPIRMVTPPDPPDIVNALKKIFVAKDVACEGNIFDCATALSVVYMDSMLEAADPKKLLEQLYARSPPTYLSIDHVNRNVGSVAELANTAQRGRFFLSDNSATSTFTKDHIAKEDLQVGDHIYIWNHGLYPRLNPHGAWRGEHALLTDFGNRAVQDDNGYRFMGHGLPRHGETGAVPRFYGGLLNELNTLLFRAYRMGGLFLFFMKSNGTAFPGDVTKDLGNSAVDNSGVTRTVDFYRLDVTFHYRNNMVKAPRGKAFAQSADRTLVAWHIPATREFGIHEKKTLAAAKLQGIRTFVDGLRFGRVSAPGAPADMFDPLQWSIPYAGKDGAIKQHQIYQKKGAGMEPLLLEMSDLYSEPFYKVDPASTGIFATRPLVNTGSAYTSFLTSSGAIA